MRTFFLIATFRLLSLGVASASSCKCTPSDSCYPTQDEWSSFSQNLSQPLITNQRPLGASCYQSSADYDNTACNVATANQYSEDFRAASSNALMWVNFEALITNDSMQACPITPESGGTCNQGRVPVYSVNATTVEDIQKTIEFVQQYNLRLVVKNTGHELGGRAFGSEALELYVHYFQGVDFVDTFVPEGCSDSNCTWTGGAITVEAGAQWNDAYTTAQQNNRSIAGGFVPYGSVGAGAGWSLGGGHSPLSPFYGLGVDNVLQYTVVLPNASYVTVNAVQNTDLFWALRGGGGPSFGVTTSVTYKTHPNPPITGAFYEASVNSTDAYLELLELWVSYHNRVADAGWAGSWPFVADTGLYLTLITQGAPPNQTANETLQGFFDESATIPGVNVTIALTVQYPDFYEWYYDNLVDSSMGYGLNYTAGLLAGVNVVVSSWLVPRDVYDSNSTALATALANISSASPFLVGGGAVAEVDPDSAAITPAFRRTISDIGTFATFQTDNTTTAATFQQQMTELHDQYAPLRELAPVPYGGQYYNEPDLLETDWQTAFWGWHYDRLLAIKQEIDPNDLLLVRKGVNSEGWDDELLCKED